MVEFDEIRLNLERIDSQREKVIKKSRDVVRLSKQLIYSVHRNEIHKAEKFKEEIKTKLKEVVDLTKDYPHLYYSGSIKVAEQEYVEALTFLGYVKDDKLVGKNELNVSDENYLAGLCDLTGELVRYAINSAIKEKYEVAVKVKDFVTELYFDLSKFDFRNGELRRKYDSIKYDLKKLEDLVFQLKVKKVI